MTRIASRSEPRQRLPRIRDKAYLAYIAALGGEQGFGCVICRGKPCEVAHVRFAEVCRACGGEGACWEANIPSCALCSGKGYRFGKRPTGMGEKPDDRWTVPLCPDCHRIGKSAQHNMNERLHWEAKGIDVLQLCWDLQQAYPSIEAGVEILEKVR